MPLKKGSSKETFSKNVSELMTSHKQGGSFAKGKSKKKALQMALRIAFDIKRRNKKDGAKNNT